MLSITQDEAATGLKSAAKQHGCQYGLPYAPCMREVVCEGGKCHCAEDDDWWELRSCAVHEGLFVADLVKTWPERWRSGSCDATDATTAEQA